MSFFGVPDLDSPLASAVDFAHNQQTINANEQDVDAYSAVSGKSGDVIWVAQRSYTVENKQFYAVVFCDDNYDEYQVGITTIKAEADEEYRAAVLALAGQDVIFTRSDVDSALLRAAKNGGPLTVSARPSFLEV